MDSYNFKTDGKFLCNCDTSTHKIAIASTRFAPASDSYNNQQQPSVLAINDTYRLPTSHM